VNLFKYWDLPAESVIKFQFEKDGKQLDDNEVDFIKKEIKKYKKELYVEAKEGHSILAKDLNEYMKLKNLYDIEKKTAEIALVKNGGNKWIKQSVKKDV